MEEIPLLWNWEDCQVRGCNLLALDQPAKFWEKLRIQPGNTAFLHLASPVLRLLCPLKKSAYRKNDGN